MSTLRRLMLCAGVALSIAGNATAQQPDRIAAATEAAQQWLALTDGGQYAASWDAAAAPFQKVVPKAKWDEAMQSVRLPLGAVKRRTQGPASYTTTLPGAPEGEYIVIVYQTDFANKSGATETVTPMRAADGSWKVSGYFIK